MAEKAQQEPTMEEILSSIRKIISDDGVPQETTQTEAPAQAESFQMSDEADDLDDLSFDDDAFDAPLPKDEAGVLEALTAEPDAAFNDDVFEVDSEEEVFEASNDTYDELPPLDDLSSFEVEERLDDGIVETATFEAPEFDAPEFEIEDNTPAAPFEAFEPEPVIEEIAPEPIYAAEPPAEPELEPAFTEEPRPMAATSLTDDKTAAAAAGSLSKLFSKVEFGEEAGGNNTIEGLVREMLRPMLKEWLDENLPGIVDKHVEAEVKRIASRAG